MSWFVYLIQSESNDKLYCGISPDPYRRLRKHNGIAKGGAKATRAGRPWYVVYFEGPMTKSEALSREYEIKQLQRRKKLNLVNDYLVKVGACRHDIVTDMVCQSCTWVFETPEPLKPEVVATIEEAQRLLEQ